MMKIIKILILLERVLNANSIIFAIEIGPCGGKTTGQARLCSFFETLGWKVLRVPETATVLLGGGIKFSELSDEQGMTFQEELLRTMMQIENTFFQIADYIDRDVLVICDRGTMDASAFISKTQWEEILSKNSLHEVDIRDTRYNQIIHMVSAANGAEPFYSVEDHSCRSEGLELARDLDSKAAQAWVGHPYFDVIDNSSDFETKVKRMIQTVCQRLGIDVRDRLQTNAKKVKFLVQGPLPVDEEFPIQFQDFSVIHDYLRTNSDSILQARLRKRGVRNHWNYTYTVRRPELEGQAVEVKTTLTARDYNMMLAQKDYHHVTVYKTRRCFLYNDQYFQMDIYKDPCHPRCKGLILLETYSTLSGAELRQRLPEFLAIVKEVTGDPRYSMFNLSLKERWDGNKHFCKVRGQNLLEEEASTTNGLPQTGPSSTTSSLSNVSGTNDGVKSIASSSDEEQDEKMLRNEKFLACSDELAENHHRSNGTKGYGKFKGAGLNGHNGHSNGCSNGKVGSNGTKSNGTSKGATATGSCSSNGTSNGTKQY
jgi:hypothetical protein